MEGHEGDCDDNGIYFLEENFHFRQCEMCRFVVERREGCNHMTCRCGYQFCYICGIKWTGSNHYCMPKPRPKPKPKAEPKAEPKVEPQVQFSHQVNNHRQRVTVPCLGLFYLLVLFPIDLCLSLIVLTFLAILVIVKALVITPFTLGFEICSSSNQDEKNCFAVLMGLVVPYQMVCLVY